MKKIIHHDIYMGAGLLLISILAYVKATTMPDTGVATFPKMILILMIACSLFIVLGGMKKTKLLNAGKMKKNSLITFGGTKLPLLSCSIIAVYAALINILGFFISTALFITVFMMFYRVKDVKKIILTIVGTTVFIYLLFSVQLNVQLPTGILF